MTWTGPAAGGASRSASIEVRRLGIDDVGLVAQIDRSERVEVEYTVVDGELVERPVTMTDVPTWDQDGDGPFSVAHHLEWCGALVRDDAVLLGAYEGDSFCGMAIVDPDFEPPLAWLAFLHVSAQARRRGAASALWGAAAELARTAGAEELYVSATPTGSAVGFYLSRGCVLADPVHPALWAEEPDDVHLVCSLAGAPGRPAGTAGDGTRG